MFRQRKYLCPYLSLYSFPCLASWCETESQNLPSSWACVYIPYIFMTAAKVIDNIKKQEGRIPTLYLTLENLFSYAEKIYKV
jgi:hypothetical protein